MRSLAVFCGSATGRDPRFAEVTREFARSCAARDIAIVYGGASVGLMGILADAALAAHGTVIGVLPRFLANREVGHRSLTRLELVDSMHERKARMAELADGFVALPGGIGTLDEVMDVWTWRHLALHEKPIALLNTAGFYDALLSFFDHGVSEGLIRTSQRDALLVCPDVPALFDALG